MFRLHLSYYIVLTFVEHHPETCIPSSFASSLYRIVAHSLYSTYRLTLAHVGLDIALTSLRSIHLPTSVSPFPRISQASRRGQSMIDCDIALPLVKARLLDGPAHFFGVCFLCFFLSSSFFLQLFFRIIVFLSWGEPKVQKFTDFLALQQSFLVRASACKCIIYLTWGQIQRQRNRTINFCAPNFSTSLKCTALFTFLFLFQLVRTNS